jgi:hypothetical protein
MDRGVNVRGRTVSRGKMLSWLLLPLVLALFVFSRPAGYCRAEARVLAKEELCEKFLKKHVSEGWVHLTAGDRTARDFLSRQSNACHVDTSAMVRFRRYGSVDAVFSDTIHLSIHYAMTDKAKNLRRLSGDALWSELLELSPCGDFRGASGGNY